MSQNDTTHLSLCSKLIFSCGILSFLLSDLFSPSTFSLGCIFSSNVSPIVGHICTVHMLWVAVTLQPRLLWPLLVVSVVVGLLLGQSAEWELESMGGADVTAIIDQANRLLYRSTALPCAILGCLCALSKVCSQASWAGLQFSLALVSDGRLTASVPPFFYSPESLAYLRCRFGDWKCASSGRPYKTARHTLQRSPHWADLHNGSAQQTCIGCGRAHSALWGARRANYNCNESLTARHAHKLRLIEFLGPVFSCSPSGTAEDIHRCGSQLKCSWNVRLIFL